MTILTRLAAAFTIVALTALPAVAADVRTSPAGWWQTVDGEARVKVTLCGDGTALCALLTAVAGEARTPGNLQLINSYVVDHAAKADTNRWEGTLHYDGQTAPGHITLVGSNAITVVGCQMGMCKTLQFRRLAAPSSNVAEATAQMPPRTVGLTIPE
jgi:hypothetical protein